MKIKVATIYLHNGKLVADRSYEIAIRAQMAEASKAKAFARAFFKRERSRIVQACHRRTKATDVSPSISLQRKCENVATGLRIRMRVGGRRSIKLRTKVVCRSLRERILAEADKVRASNKNAERNKNRLFCKCLSVNRNMKMRCGLGKHNCASARELERLFHEQGGRCALTGDVLSYQEYTDNARCDHKVPVSLGGKSMKEDLQWVTATVNAAKGQMTNEEFVEMCRKVVAHVDGAVAFKPAQQVGGLFG
jgi:hypothetical protein